MREVTWDDLRRELSIPEWWAWTRETLAELAATEAGREYMRFTKGPIKRLKEEVVPTLRFDERHFPNELLLASFPATDQPGSPDAFNSSRKLKRSIASPGYMRLDVRRRATPSHCSSTG